MISVTMAYVRRTKDLCRYEEVPSDGPPLVGVLYVSKTRLGNEAPKRIRVTVTTEAADATD